MAQDIRVSQWTTIIVGEAPNTIEITPDPVASTSSAPSVLLSLTLTPDPAVLVSAALAPTVAEPGSMQPVVGVGIVPPISITFTPAPEPPLPSCEHETQPAYLAQLQNLLPRGAAWTRDPEAVLTALLSAAAVELSCIDARARTLLAETDPRTTLELIDEWERALALPEVCTGPLETLQERRDAIVQRLSSVGGASPADIERVLAERGFPEARVVEYLPFVVGRSRVGEPMTSPQKAFRVGSSRVGEALNNMEGWLYTWGVYAPDNSFRYFRVGASTVGEPLRTWGNSALECLVRELAPAHTFVLFFYFVALRPDPVIGTLSVPSISVS